MTRERIEMLAPIGSRWVDGALPPHDYSRVWVVTGYAWFNTTDNWGADFELHDFHDQQRWEAGRGLLSRMTRID